MSSSYPEGNFGGNQLLEGSISLSPLYPHLTNDLPLLPQSFQWGMDYTLCRLEKQLIGSLPVFIWPAHPHLVSELHPRTDLERLSAVIRCCLVETWLLIHPILISFTILQFAQLAPYGGHRLRFLLFPAAGSLTRL